MEHITTTLSETEETGSGIGNIYYKPFEVTNCIYGTPPSVTPACLRCIRDGYTCERCPYIISQLEPISIGAEFDVDQFSSVDLGVEGRIATISLRSQATQQNEEQTILDQMVNIVIGNGEIPQPCLLYTSPSPRDATLSRMPSSA